MDCATLPDPVKSASNLYREVIVAPFLARFYVFVKRHAPTEVQVRVLCLTDETIESTLESQEHFLEIARSKDSVEVSVSLLALHKVQ